MPKKWCMYPAMRVASWTANNGDDDGYHFDYTSFSSKLID
jgi:hypothetical protein